jgi:hypothetical protein
VHNGPNFLLPCPCQQSQQTPSESGQPYKNRFCVGSRAASRFGQATVVASSLCSSTALEQLPLQAWGGPQAAIAAGACQTLAAMPSRTKQSHAVAAAEMDPVGISIAVPDDLTCPLCHELFTEQVTTACNHLFCRQVRGEAAAATSLLSDIFCRCQCTLPALLPLCAASASGASLTCAGRQMGTAPPRSAPGTAPCAGARCAWQRCSSRRRWTSVHSRPSPSWPPSAARRLLRFVQVSHAAGLSVHISLELKAANTLRHPTAARHRNGRAWRPAGWSMSKSTLAIHTDCASRRCGGWPALSAIDRHFVVCPAVQLPCLHACRAPGAATTCMSGPSTSGWTRRVRTHPALPNTAAMMHQHSCLLLPTTQGNACRLAS